MIISSPLPVRDKNHRYRVYTVTGVFLREVFSRENVSKVGAAVDALDFHAYPIGVGQAFYGIGDFIIKAGPAAACFKLAFGAVKFCAATLADVGAFLPERVVFACEGHLGAFMHNNLFFFWAEFFAFRLLRSRQNNH
jgi:hypothetical protein